MKKESEVVKKEGEERKEQKGKNRKKRKGRKKEKEEVIRGEHRSPKDQVVRKQLHVGK